VVSGGLAAVGGGSKVASWKTASEEHLRERRSSTEPLPGHVADPTRSLPSYRARSHRVGSGAHPMHPPRARVPAAWTHPSATRSACVAGPRTRRRRLYLARTRRRCMPAWAPAPGTRWMRARSGTPLLRVHVFCAISLSPEDRRHRNRIGDLNTFDRLLEGFANWLRKSCLACSLIYLSVNAHITRAQVLSANLRGDCSLR
jgi:hypothetical protein